MEPRALHALRNILEICKGELARAELARPRVYKDAFGREVIYEQLVHHGRVTGHADTQEELLRRETGEEPLGKSPDYILRNGPVDAARLCNRPETEATNNSYGVASDIDDLIERLQAHITSTEDEVAPIKVKPDSDLIREAAAALAKLQEQLDNRDGNVKCLSEMVCEAQAEIASAQKYAYRRALEDAATAIENDYQTHLSSNANTARAIRAMPNPYANKKSEGVDR